MAESKKVVAVGIPGVGKTTLVERVREILAARGISVSVSSFGTAMFEEAQTDGITDRDHLRKLPISEQKRYQRMAAERLAGLDDHVVIIDTHAFISTPSGFHPGLPAHVINVISPSIFVSVSARPEDVYSRRLKDKSRNRDHISTDHIKRELAFQESIVSACSVLSGSPVYAILNGDGRVEAAAAKVVEAIGV